MAKKVVQAVCGVAAYCRLSREDGDKIESDSISNQKSLLTDFVARQADLELTEFYIDDGFTGTNFNRPDFQRMLRSIEAGKIQCVLVKDLSRFGRDYIETGRYLERWLPAHDVRFIAINDNIDSNRGPYDMLLPVKNVFNAQYAKDISQKVRTSFRVKQERGEFIGAFACYGYRKDPANHNKLMIDPNAASVVRRIFADYESGIGKVKIAKNLNAEGTPCPAEYKRLMGEKYNNGRKIDATTYWTYATIHYILNNRMYAGDMEQARYQRSAMHGKAQKADKSDWIVVEKTHENIISPEQWERTRHMVQQRTLQLDFTQNVSLFAGFLKCGDCGRSMSKTTCGNRTHFSCGSYKRYGATVCTPHYIPQIVLEQIVLDDLNRIMTGIQNLRKLAERSVAQSTPVDCAKADTARIRLSIDRVARLKKGAYEDYKDGVISKEDFLQYKEDYEKQNAALRRQLEQLAANREEESPLDRPWVKSLLTYGKLSQLDRVTVAETIQEIRVFEDKRIEITYLFSDELRAILED